MEQFLNNANFIAQVVLAAGVVTCLVSIFLLSRRVDKVKDGKPAIKNVVVGDTDKVKLPMDTLILRSKLISIMSIYDALSKDLGQVEKSLLDRKLRGEALRIKKVHDLEITSKETAASILGQIDEEAE